MRLSKTFEPSWASASVGRVLLLLTPRACSKLDLDLYIVSSLLSSESEDRSSIIWMIVCLS